MLSLPAIHWVLSSKESVHLGVRQYRLLRQLVRLSRVMRGMAVSYQLANKLRNKTILQKACSFKSEKLLSTLNS